MWPGICFSELVSMLCFAFCHNCYVQDLLSKAMANLTFFIWTHELLPLDILLLALIDRDDDPYALRIVVCFRQHKHYLSCGILCLMTASLLECVYNMDYRKTIRKWGHFVVQKQSMFGDLYLLIYIFIWHMVSINWVVTCTKHNHIFYWFNVLLSQGIFLYKDLQIQTGHMAFCENMG